MLFNLNHQERWAEKIYFYFLYKFTKTDLDGIENISILICNNCAY